MDHVKPYANHFNDRVIKPATGLTKASYNRFASPQIEKARLLGVDQWEKSVRPQIQSAQAQAAKLYDANIGPHVQKVSAVTGPYYSQARDTAEAVHKNHVLPTFQVAQPILHKGYATTQEFIVGTACPVARHGWSNTIIFIDGTMWPFVKGVYSDNVRPQLVMISDRIAKYQEGRKLQAIVDNAEVSTTSTTSSIEVLTTTSSTQVTASPSASTTDTDFDKIFQDDDDPLASKPPPKAPVVEQPVKPERATDETIAKDLSDWQTKFAMAADKGMDDLRDRAGELAADLAKTDIDGLGRGLENALQMTIENELDTVRSKIIAAVSTLPEEESSEAEKAAAEDIVKAIRKSGLAIKDKAMKVRNWAQKFERDVDVRIASAASSTLEVLDEIRDVGLQQLGMKWAWMDGVTYKHWAKYHSLKKKLGKWQNEVRLVAIDHPEAAEAKAIARRILEESMALTEDAAKELVKLKEVAKWKIRAHDSTNDFSEKVMPPAAASAVSELAESSASLIVDIQDSAASVASGVSSAAGDAASSASSVVSDAGTGLEGLASTASSVVVGTSTGTVESVLSEARSGASEMLDDFTKTIVEMGTATETINLGMASDASSKAAEGIKSASSAVFGTVGPAEAAALKASSAILGSSVVSDKIAASVISAATEAQDTAEDLASSASSVVLGSSDVVDKATASASSAASVISGSAQEAASSASSVIYGSTGTGEELLSSASEVVDDILESAATYSSKASKSVETAASKGSSFLPGANAQEVRGQFPIFDDFFDDSESASYSQKLQDMVNGAGDKYADLTSAVSEAIYGTTQGQVESVTSVAAAQYSQALAAASNILFPPPQGTVESVASVVTDRYNQAVAAARSAMAPQKTSGAALESILSSMVLRADAAYTQAVGVAKNRYDEGMSIASDQVIGTKKPVHEKMFSAIQSALDGASTEALSRRDDALAAASSYYSSMSRAVASTQGPMASISAVASSRLSEALSLASDQYSSAKAAVGATPTPAHQQYLNSARRSYYEAMGYAYEQQQQFVAGASEVLYGTPAPAYQRALDAASSQFAQATAVAAANMGSLLDAASSAVGATKTTPAQSVLNEIQSQYDAAIAAASSSLAGASDSVSNVAGDNWAALVSKASTQVYGTPKPFYEEYASSADEYYQTALSQAGGAYDSVASQAGNAYGNVASQAGEYASQITGVAGDQYAAVQAYVSELISGREPDFTESVYNRLQSAYYTGLAAVPSQASSLASEAYDSGLSMASSASSAVSAFFQPPPAYTAALDSFQAQIESAVNAASIAASEAVYGTQAGYAEQATKAFGDAASSAQDAISVALYGTPTGTAESLASAAGERYGSVTSAIADSVDAAQSVVGSVAGDVGAKVSELIYGPEQGAFESGSSAILQAVESARSRIAAMATDVSGGAAEVLEAVSSSLDEAASVVSSSVTAATDKVKDEL